MTISTSARRQIDALATAQPEAGPWLALLSLTIEECANPAWDAAAAATRLQPERAPTAPLLAGATIPLAAGLAERWVRRLLQQAGSASPEAAPLRDATHASTLDPPALIEAAINGEAEEISAIAIALGVDEEALAAIAGLAAMPLLQALRRRFGPAVDAHWSEGCCPVCGDWPLAAELRGLERARRLRCGRCGADWAQPGVRCPYCGVRGHAARSALVSEQDGESRKVETCTRCHGYLKAISTLRAWAGDEVVLADLASIDLDLAALERDLTRPNPRPLVPPVTITT